MWTLAWALIFISDSNTTLYSPRLQRFRNLISIYAFLMYLVASLKPSRPRDPVHKRSYAPLPENTQCDYVNPSQVDRVCSATRAATLSLIWIQVKSRSKSSHIPSSCAALDNRAEATTRYSQHRSESYVSLRREPRRAWNAQLSDKTPNLKHYQLRCVVNSLEMT